jgi:hypothetical protein
MGIMVRMISMLANTSIRKCKKVAINSSPSFLKNFEKIKNAQTNVFKSRKKRDLNLAIG